MLRRKPRSCRDIRPGAAPSGLQRPRLERATMPPHLIAHCNYIAGHENFTSALFRSLPSRSQPFPARCAGDRGFQGAPRPGDPARPGRSTERLAGVPFRLRRGTPCRFAHVGESLAVVSLLAERWPDPALRPGGREAAGNHRLALRHPLPPLGLRALRAPRFNRRAEPLVASGRGQSPGRHDLLRRLPAAGAMGFPGATVVRHKAAALLSLGSNGGLRHPDSPGLVHGRHSENRRAMVEFGNGRFHGASSGGIHD